MKISNLLLTMMVSASLLISFDANAQKIKKTSTIIKKNKPKNKKNHTISQINKNDSQKKLQIERENNICEACGKG